MKVEVSREDGRLLAIPKAGRAPFMAISGLVQEQGWDVHELSVERGRLDEVFRQITLGNEGQEIAGVDISSIHLFWEIATADPDAVFKDGFE